MISTNVRDRESPGSNLWRQTGHREVLHGLPQSLHAYDRIVTKYTTTTFSLISLMSSRFLVTNEAADCVIEIPPDSSYRIIRPYITMVLNVIPELVIWLWGFLGPLQCSSVSYCRSTSCVSYTNLNTVCP